jgi:hypothetical protein
VEEEGEALLLVQLPPQGLSQVVHLRLHARPRPTNNLFSTKIVT